MNKLIRYWNQNRLKIIIIGIIIVFIIILIQTINGILESANTDSNTANAVIKDTSIPSESVITGEKLPEETTNTNVNIIKEFVDYANKKDYQSAYNLLTEECKNELYSTVDLFIQNYCNKIFNTEKTYKLELWQYTTNTYTYKITYTENNILETGNINSNNNVEDYITVIENSEGSKLNINNFIEKRNINKTQEQEGIQITVNNRYMYTNYEKYSITIKNNTDKNILLSDGLNGNDICLIDNNDTEYDSILNEIPLINLEINAGMQKTIEVRFYKMYNLYRTIRYINFKNIITDKESYQINSNNVSNINMRIDI